ncbi:lytic transglycosylase domain-containing protein, partial [Patescibacteria group bacterium]|nr:lytic transglycosylase domain-containing protein [Patescibacteria group bacterium]
KRILLFIIIFGCVFVSSAQIKADEVDEIISEVCRQYDIDKRLVYCVIETESSFDPAARSNCDARGLMQITPETWQRVCDDLLGVCWDFEDFGFDMRKNIEVGVRYLLWIEGYLKLHKNELQTTHLELVLACYNAGPGNVKKANFQVPPFSETQNYIAKVLSDFDAD